MLSVDSFGLWYSQNDCVSYVAQAPGTHFLNKKLLGVCWMSHIWGDYDDLFFFEKKMFNAVRIGLHLSKLFTSTFQPITDQHHFTHTYGYDGTKQQRVGKITAKS